MTLFYYEDGLLTERDFFSLKMLTQFRRRHKITDYRIFQDGEFVIYRRNKPFKYSEVVSMLNEFSKPFDAPEPSLYVDKDFGVSMNHNTATALGYLPKTAKVL